ncbi:helix-turn-helix transcriptional regulator [Streptomyces sp. NBC_00237]|uniref:helix-turn-helix transcriptional regulator n=1 Tax=Streptomyces sp. NBC_00237 TaxID=2975687 RepID=UPI00338D8E16
MNTKGNLIRSHRERKDWTQARLAYFMGVSPQAVGLWENGRRQMTDGHWGSACYLLKIPMNDALSVCTTNSEKRHVLVAYTVAFKELDNDDCRD